MSMFHEYSKIAGLNFPLDENIIWSHEGTHHICLMKRFPTCTYSEDLKDYQQFHLRCYIPKKYLMNIKRKIERAIVVINGLDEMDSFGLYDQLGLRLAEENIASILIPLPGHLHRHAKHRNKNPSHNARPSDELFGNPKLSAEMYFQVMSELDILLNHLLFKGCSEQNDDCSFFRNLFGPHVRISLLGYSIGSLVALAHFIENSNTYNACFSLNGGIQIGDLRFPERFIKQGHWKKFATEVSLFWSTQYVEHAFDKQDYGKLFLQLFLGSFTDPLKDVLKDLSRRMLFVFGGADSLIPFENLKKIEPEDHGLSILKIPGLGHFLPTEKEWSKWLDIVVSLLNSFEENAGHELLTFKEIVEALIKMDFKHPFINRNPRLPQNNDFFQSKYDLASITESSIRDLAKRLLQCSLAYSHPDDLFSELTKEKERMLIGNILIKNNCLEELKLNECLDEQKNQTLKLGEILLRKSYINENDLKKALLHQDRYYGENPLDGGQVYS